MQLETWKLATENLSMFRTRGFSSDHRQTHKTVALWLSKFWMFQSGILKLLQFLQTFKNWMRDFAEGVKQQNALALPNLAAIQQVGMRFHNTFLMHILKVYYI